MSDITNTAMKQPAVARRQAWRLLAVSFIAHTPYVLITVAYALIFAIAADRAGVATGEKSITIFLGTAAISIPVLLLAVVIIEFYRMVRYERPERPIPALLRRIKAFFFDDGRRWALGLPLLFILLPFMSIFSDIKARIPAFIPFSWDRQFDELDRIIHFGTRPWEWLQPVLGYAPITFLINVNYNFWFIAMWMFWAWFAWQEKPGVNRTRAFVSFMLLWAVGGSLWAVAFSSAGPCYFGRLGLTPDPYAPLMTYLDQVNQILPIWAVDTQNLLWKSYVDGGLLQSISAMPSMHNATTLLFVLACWHLGPMVRGLTIAHAVLIFLGSIHLGWHYAVDAYVAWGLTLIVWFTVKPFAVWWESTARKLALAMEPQA